jgi:hypothetical protein
MTLVSFLCASVHSRTGAMLLENSQNKELMRRDQGNSRIRMFLNSMGEPSDSRQR